MTYRELFRGCGALQLVGQFLKKDPGGCGLQKRIDCLRILTSWEAAAMSDTIMGSFRLSGFRYTGRGEDDFVTFDPQHLVLPDGVQLPTADEPQRQRRPTDRSGPRIRVNN